jgi:glycosyltransferase involved in cell wall biosynthesis
MRRKILELTAQQRFDCIVSDFLFPAPNLPDLAACVLFQHNVESAIWERHTAHASGPARRAYLRLQARRMFAYEGHVCRSVKRVIAVSETDAETMRKHYRVARVSAVPTGVDLEFFSPPPGPPHRADLVFLGSMDWMPNIDGITWFAREVLPLIYETKPNCRLAIVGRKPTAGVLKLAQQDPHIVVTGTVEDVRPWLWGSRVSIVPLRIGGGTRLKIYEAMAARIPVVSTTVGAEGLAIADGDTIYLADTPREFARRCTHLLEDAAERARLSELAWQMVATRFSWDVVSRIFEGLLLS